MINLILISLLCGKVGFEGSLVSQSVFSIGSQRLVQLDAYKPLNTFVYIVEGIGATVGGIGGVYAGAFGGWFLYYIVEENGHFIDEIVPYLYGGMAGGLILGSACGTTIAGKIMKQRGSLWKSMIGSTVGMLIGGGLGAALYGIGGPSIMPVVMCFPITGAVIGYNWGIK
jgi:hypothetical protein